MMPILDFKRLASALLLTTLCSNVPPRKNISGLTGAGAYCDVLVRPAFQGQPYTVDIHFQNWEAGAHYLTVGWQSSLAPNSYTFGTKTFNKAYFPYEYKAYSGSAGQIQEFNLYVPGQYVAEWNTLIMFDYNILTGQETVVSRNFKVGRVLPQSGWNLLESPMIYGNTYAYLNPYGTWETYTDTVSTTGLKQKYECSSDNIVPLEEMIFDFYNYQNKQKRTPESSTLFLTVFGDNYLDFDPYVGNGAIHQKDSIRIPLSWQQRSDEKYRPILSPTVTNFDLGNGPISSSNEVRLPVLGGAYPTYHFRFENSESGDLSYYYFEFDLEPAAPFIGSCQNARWCVEVH